MAAAIQLAARVGRRSDVEVTLVNAHEKFTERLRLPMTTTGQQLAELSIPELLAGTGARFVRGWVTALDVRAKTVRIDDDRVLPYDTLVYGLGSVADTAAVPGVDDYAYTLNSAQDAEVLGGRLNQVGHGTVVVVGSGLTGVESAAVRQAAHRAREHVQARRPRFTAQRSRQREVAERFFSAATGGVVNALMELPAPDVTLWTDGGGKVRQALRPIVGATTVASWFAAIGTVTYQGVAPADMRAELVEINGGPGMPAARARPGHRDGHLRLRRRRPDHGYPQRCQPRQGPRGRRRLGPRPRDALRSVRRGEQLAGQRVSSTSP